MKKKMVASDHEFASAAHTAVSGKPKTSNIAPWNPKNFWGKIIAKLFTSSAIPHRLQRIHGAPTPFDKLKIVSRWNGRAMRAPTKNPFFP
ncbi:MAG: hypothetical protein IJY66_06985 [Clostridia bacterium]|nr:hypothetical protein [Clostridia bacterium]